MTFSKVVSQTLCTCVVSALLFPTTSNAQATKISTEYLMTLYAPLEAGQEIDSSLYVNNVRPGGWVKGPRITGTPYIPRILAKITREFQRGLSGQEGALGYAEQIECLTLQLGELQGKGLDELVVAEQGVTFGEAEEAQDLFGGGTLAEALFGVEG